MARINGTEPPPPLEKAEPVVEAVVEEAVQETVQPEPEPVKEDVVKKTKAKNHLGAKMKDLSKIEKVDSPQKKLSLSPPLQSWFAAQWVARLRSLRPVVQALQLAALIFMRKSSG